MSATILPDKKLETNNRLLGLIRDMLGQSYSSAKKNTYSRIIFIFFFSIFGLFTMTFFFNASISQTYCLVVLFDSMNLITLIFHIPLWRFHIQFVRLGLQKLYSTFKNSQCLTFLLKCVKRSTIFKIMKKPQLIVFLLSSILTYIKIHLFFVISGINFVIVL